MSLQEKQQKFAIFCLIFEIVCSKLNTNKLLLYNRDQNMYIVKLPSKVGKSSQVLVSEWLKEKASNVAAGDVICKVQAGHEIFEIEAPVAGNILEIVAVSGSIAEKDAPIAILGNAGEDASKVLASLKAEKEAPAPKKPAPPVETAVAPEPVKPIVEEKKEEIMPSKPAAVNNDDVVAILMPQAGQSMEEGTIIAWKVKEGDNIEVGQVICEIETDKATMDVEAIDAGRLAKIVAAEGEIVEVKVPIAYLADEGVDISSVTGQAPATAEVQTSAPAAAPAAAPPPPAVSSEGITAILMPQAGQSMEEGTIIEWKVAEGDTIEVGQAICEIETDKATMEVEAIDAGRIAKIVAVAGDIIEVKLPIAYIAEADIDIDGFVASLSGGAVTAAPATAAAPAAQESGFVAEKAAATVSATGRVKASPAARKIAAAKGVDLAAVGAGSGVGGRIISTDVENAQISGVGQIKASPAAKKLAAAKGIDLATIGIGSGPGGRITTDDVEKVKVEPGQKIKRPLSKMRKAIANNLLFSKQNIPHFYTKATIDAGKLFDTYRKTKEKFKCSVNDFITLACARAIAQYPEFRSQYKGDHILENSSVNIGIAVGTEDGLTVPVVLDADKMTLKELAESIREVVGQAREGKLVGLGQGIFTISNMGMFGVDEFTAIINPPEAAILAVGAIKEGVVVKDGKMIPTRLMTMNLSSDHRVIDGVVGAKFMQTVREMLEDPEQLVG
jgi:pyruvate dehydrogenase E2 component (dihydrolipoamide acetyltransferase)